MYAFGVIFFFLTVSGDKQPWNDQHISSNGEQEDEVDGDTSRTVSRNNSQAQLTNVRKLSSPESKPSTKTDSSDGDNKSKASSTSPRDKPDGKPKDTESLDSRETGSSTTSSDTTGTSQKDSNEKNKEPQKEEEKK